MIPATSKDNELICEAYMNSRSATYYLHGEQNRGFYKCSQVLVTDINLTEETFKTLVIAVLSEQLEQDVTEMVTDTWSEWYSIENGSVFTFEDDNGYFVYASKSRESLIQYNRKFSREEGTNHSDHHEDEDGGEGEEWKKA